MYRSTNQWFVVDQSILSTQYMIKMTFYWILSWIVDDQSTLSTQHKIVNQYFQHMFYVSQDMSNIPLLINVYLSGHRLLLGQNNSRVSAAH